MTPSSWMSTQRDTSDFHAFGPNNLNEPTDHEAVALTGKGIGVTVIPATGY